MKYALAFLALLPAAASGETQYWDYKDWRIIVDTVDTGEDLRVTCRAMTGGDGLRSLAIEVSNGDTLPPDHYPAPVLHESAPRGYDTVMQDGQRVLFQFSLDDLTEGFVTAGLNDEGIKVATARAHEGDSLWMLQTMRTGDMLSVTLEGELVYRASLSGFTAAYGKIAEQCGFPTTGVIE
ncbi:hypothetical protein ACJ5NV_19935 [Loktanella agnita]|uniref:hypothetical protein n=1 Tax=Loktanella agnita TaxID=287097 RepID=UPI0039894FC8